MLITNINEENCLLTRLENLIAESEEMRVLVGFFYFWGISALHSGLVNNQNFKMRILVGLEAEDHAGKIVEFASEADASASEEDRRNDFIKSLSHVMRSREIDTKKYYERVSLFIELVRTGKIEIRKTRVSNHAKLYHFTWNQSLANTLNRDYCWITGSSNLTRPGLLEQNELNVQLLDFGGEESKQYFDIYWEDAIPLTDDPATKDKILKVVGGDESILVELTPFEAYVLVLKSFLEHRKLVDKTNSILRLFAEPKDLDGNIKYRPMQYQIDAINQALSILGEYNGVIVADVAGLGKSVIGSILGSVTRKRGIVIAPPGLVGDPHAGSGWWGYLQDFRLNDWVVVSRGLLEDVLSLVNRQKDFEIVVIDEAHYFRNQDSEDYHYLSQICRGKEVVLMTATPFSNKPSDMLSLLKLFTPARQSPLVPNGDLESVFRAYQLSYDRMDYVLKNLENEEKVGQVESHLTKLKIDLALEPQNYSEIRHLVKNLCKALAVDIRHVMEPVMIRRNRLDLRHDPDYAAEVGRDLPTMHDPVEQFYALSPAQSEFYDRVISDYFGPNSLFTGAIYQPGAYAVSDDSGAEDEDAEGESSGSNLTNQQRNMYKFIRRLLVRRFESSFGAFSKTLDNLIAAHESVNRLATPEPLGRGLVVLDRTFMDRLLNMEDASDEEVSQALQEYEDSLNRKGDNTRRRNIQVFNVSSDFSESERMRFFQNLASDIRLLKSVKTEITALDLVADDPKARELVKVIRNVLNGQHHHVVVKTTEPQRKVLVFSEFGDTVDHLNVYLDATFPGQVMTVRSMSKSLENTIRKNFDGSCNAGLQQDSFKVLLATDKMSEGFNLNRAGLVINYDIPWNPTRVIQRVGRINRIGTKVFDDLYIFNFFPTLQGAELNNVRLIAQNKMFMIHSSIGEDAKIFDVNEEPTPAGLFERLRTNPDNMEEESFLTQCKIEWATIKKEHPEVLEKLKLLPCRVKTVEDKTPSGTYLFVRKGMTLFSMRLRRAGAEMELVNMPVQDAMGEIRCPFGTLRATGFSEAFWDSYKDLEDAVTERRDSAVPGTMSLISKARNVLTMMLGKGVGGEFVGVLLDDLQNHGTLSDRTLRKIIEASRTEAAFEKEIKKLRKEMGSDYLEKIKSKLPPNEVVVAIEHLG